jgi:hypothetical protein
VLMTLKKFVAKNQKDVKNTEFHANFKSVEKVFKKVISKTSLTNMRKVEKYIRPSRFC